MVYHGVPRTHLAPAHEEEFQLEKALFQNNCDEFVCKVAKTSDEAVAFVELGFEYVNEIQGVHLYRKCK